MTGVRVLQVVTRMAVRGVPRHVLEIAAGLDRERFTVDVLAGRSEPGEGELWGEAEKRGIPTWHVPALQRSVDPGADIRAFTAIYRRIRQGRYDIVHTHISKAGILGRLAARLAGVPVVVHTYHGQVEEVHGRSFKSRFFLACERRAARWTDALIAVSRETARLYQDSGIGEPGQYRVIYNGIDLPRFLDYRIQAESLPGSGGAPQIGAIGSLSREKGIDVLLRALPGLVRRYPLIQLHVVGDGELRGALQGMARQLGMEHRVHFPGIVGDVREWLALFDVFVIPSRREGLPTVLLEAMAMGCPVVASRVGGIPEVVCDGESGLLVAPEDPAGLERAVDDLLQDEKRRQQMARAGRERVAARFDLKRMLQRLEEEYERLLAAGKARA